MEAVRSPTHTAPGPGGPLKIERFDSIRSRHTVAVLEVDPGLGQDVPAAQREHAIRCSRAEVITWSPDEEPRVPDSLAQTGAHGLLVLEGAAAGRFGRDGRMRAELVGPEDLLRPWVQLDDLLGAVGTMSWEVLEPMQLAVLDRRWAQTMSPWPGIYGRLLDRLVLKSRRLCFQMIAAGHPRGEDRVLLFLWQLAAQWGRVTPGGILLEIPVTHRLLAELTGSRRPTVTSAIGRLRDDGSLTPLGGRRFLLHGTAPQHLDPADVDGPVAPRGVMEAS